MDVSGDLMTAYGDSALRPRHLDSDLSVQVACTQRREEPGRGPGRASAGRALALNRGPGPGLASLPALV
jgi:hypothetical protein